MRAATSLCMHQWLQVELRMMQLKLLKSSGGKQLDLVCVCVWEVWLCVLCEVCEGVLGVEDACYIVRMQVDVLRP